MTWSGEHRAFIFQCFLENETLISTQHAFCIRFDVGRYGAIPNTETIRRGLQTSIKQVPRLTGNLLGDLRTQDHKQTSMLWECDAISQTFGHKHASALRGTRNACLYTYGGTGVKREREYEIRSALYQDILQSIQLNDILFFNYEAHFHLTSTVNKQNYRYWSEINPQELNQRPLHTPKVTVWCAIGDFEVWGPFFFEENAVMVTVRSNRYCDLFQNFVRSKVNELLNDHGQQDGVTSHTSMGIMREMFPGDVVSLRGDIERPPCSPDLAHVILFYGGT